MTSNDRPARHVDRRVALDLLRVLTRAEIALRRHEGTIDNGQ